MKQLFLLLFLFPGLARAQSSVQAPGAADSKSQSAATRIKIGGNVQTPKLQTKVPPVYPPLAIQTRISGTVKFHAIIATDGSVKQLEVISGHPLLIQAALDAVRQWRYQPTLLNGMPVEVDTTIDVVFSLEQNSVKPVQDPQFRADLLHMLDIIDFQTQSKEVGRSLFESVRPMITSSLPASPNREKIVDAYLQKLLALFESEELKEGVISGYAKYFNDDDVKALTQFYETPTGKKFSKALPDLYADLNRAGQQLAAQKVPEILLELCHEFPELKGQAKFCPREDPGKKSLLLPPAGAAHPEQTGFSFRSSL